MWGILTGMTMMFAVSLYRYRQSLARREKIRWLNEHHHQFEDELAHLERVIPQLTANGPFGLAYWRGRIAALEAVQASLPNGARRVARLLIAFKRIEK